MNILITGAFGNIGRSTLRALAGRGHLVRCFDLPSRTNQRLAAKHAVGCEVVWGDIRQFEDVQRAVHNQDLVLHLAAIIPELSHTGNKSEQEPILAQFTGQKKKSAADRLQALLVEFGLENLKVRFSFAN